MTAVATNGRRKFYVEMIKPSHYDDDGYVIQWLKAWIPSNSLACIYGLTMDVQDRNVLGDDVEIVINAYDETNTVIPIKQIIRRINGNGGDGLVCMIGVQSNQFPRALDMTRELREAGVQVAIGGFHVGGCIAMLPELPADLQEALDMGASLFAGEAEEERLDEVYRDAMARELKPIYNHLNDLPTIQDQPYPFLPDKMVERYGDHISSFDTSRGCPFQCSFCTIINVQGRKSRFRSDDDIERFVRANVAEGITRFFVTDDNLARSKNWEGVFDRLAKLKEEENIELSLLIQVDTLCHKIPGFIEKAKKAGVGRAYIGLENINPDNLLAAKKRQNRITEYRKMLQEWRAQGILTYCGYILGFPFDTPERMEEDIRIVMNELPVDVLEFFCLTPLPGSEDHKVLLDKGIWMDPDMNKYDLEHVCADHERMGRDEWQNAYNRAWDIYYSKEHVETLMKRAMGSGNKPERIWAHVLQFYGCIKFEKVHPLQGGYIRRKVRTHRRSTLPIENPLVFYPRRTVEIVKTYGGLALYAWELWRLCKKVRNDPANLTYMDTALTPVVEGEEEEGLEMFEHNESAKAAVAKAKHESEARAHVKEDVRLAS